MTSKYILGGRRLEPFHDATSPLPPPALTSQTAYAPSLNHCREASPHHFLLARVVYEIIILHDYQVLGRRGCGDTAGMQRRKEEMAATVSIPIALMIGGNRWPSRATSQETRNQNNNTRTLCEWKKKESFTKTEC